MITRGQSEQFACRIAEHFHPERIILFGSHARSDAAPDSDVDLLVIVPLNGKSAHQQAAEIYLKCRSPFPVDILVRTREEFEHRQRTHDWFIREIAREGITVYAARDD
jgi:predicted nucleotidyltransferase